MRAYMRHQFPFLGLYTARLEAVLRSLPAPPVEAVTDFALACWELPEREYQYAGAWHLRRAVGRLPPGSLPTLERLITTKSWWDTVDPLATHVVGQLVRADPDLSREMDRWIEAEDLWLARAALLHQERWKQRTDATRLFAYCLRRAGDRDFFVRKAIGWALRSYAAVDPSAVARFLAEHDGELSPLSRREAMRGVARHLH
jgi:3-methyladenine DNA glycosylase AlkD